MAAPDCCSIIDNPFVPLNNNNNNKNKGSLFIVSCRELGEGTILYRRMKEKRNRKNHVASSAGMKSGQQNASHQWTSAGEERVNYLSGGWGLLGEERKDRFVLVRLSEDDSLYPTHPHTHTHTLS